MSNPTVFMFSGQGSHYYHMGKEFFDQNPIFRHWMLKLNDIAYQNTGLSIVDELFNQTKSKADKFDQILYTHPAIFMVEYSLTRVFIESGIEPDYLLGASLGEFTAAAVAGVISAEETLECICTQAKMLKDGCQAGGMIAIISNPDFYYHSPAISLHASMVGVNFSSHFVISGDSQELRKIEDYLRSGDLLFQSLPVRYGFHSPYIEAIENEYKKYLRKFLFKKPEIPVISCSSTHCVTEFTAEYFWDVIRQPIHFQKTILELEKDHRFNYIDLGPSGTLANFVKNNLAKDSNSKFYDIMTPFGQEAKKLERVREII